MIRRYFLLILAFLLMSATSNAQVFMSFESFSYEEAVSLSKEQNKKVFLFFTADYCSWCMKQKEVLVQPEVLDELQNYIICIIDTTERKDIAQEYKIKTIPAYFILENGKVINKNIGYKNKQDFINWLDMQKRTLFKRRY